MLNTIFGIVGWIGTLLVFAGVAIRLFRPEWDQYAYWAAVAGLVCVGLYTLTQWREIGRSFQKRETKLGAMMSISVVAVLAILVGINWAVARRDKRWDLTAAGVVHAVRPDRQGAERPENAGEGARLRGARQLPALPRLAHHVHEREPEHPGRICRHGPRAGPRPRVRDRGAWHGRHGVRRPPREGDERARAGPDEQPHQGHDRPADQGVLRAGPRRAQHDGQRSARATPASSMR